ncbi:MAG: hypothetical protein Q4E05_10260 [Pseudoclavibacter sp.]|nr:hypothetical protein [Pseudoclavibacter sp.]
MTTRLLVRSSGSRAGGPASRASAAPDRAGFVEVADEGLARRACALAGLGEVPAAVVQLGACLLAVPAGSPELRRLRDFLRGCAREAAVLREAVPAPGEEPPGERYRREFLLRRLSEAYERRMREELDGEETHDAVEHGSRSYGRARSHVRLEEYRRED